MTENPTDTRRYVSTLDGLPNYNRGMIIASMIPDGSRVLDLGCGPGQLADYLIRVKGCEVTGMDWSSESLDVAHKRGVTAVQCDLNQGIPEIIEDGEFDVWLATEVLEHVFYPTKLVADIHDRIGDALFIVSFPNAAYWKSRLQLLCGKVSNVITGDPTRDGSEPFIHHFHAFDRRLMLQLLKDFTVLEERCPGRMGIPTLAMQIIYKCRGED